jgi:hypothetical protein
MDQSAEDAYSSMAPDPTFPFVGDVNDVPHSILYLPFMLTSDKSFTTLLMLYKFT